MKKLGKPGIAIMILGGMRHKKMAKPMMEQSEEEYAGEDEEDEGGEESEGSYATISADEAKQVLGEDAREGQEATFYVTGRVESVSDSGVSISIQKVTKDAGGSDASEKEKEKTVKINPAPSPS